MTKKYIPTNNVKLLLLLLLLIVLIFQFLLGGNNYLSNKHFFNLLLFSLVTIALHYGTSINVWLMKSISPKIEGHISLKIFNFLRFYLIYILVFCYQIISIFSNNAHEYFKSV